MVPVWRFWQELVGSTGEGCSLISSTLALLDEWGITKREERTRYRKLVLYLETEKTKFYARKRDEKKPQEDNAPQPGSRKGKPPRAGG